MFKIYLEGSDIFFLFNIFKIVLNSQYISSLVNRPPAFVARQQPTLPSSVPENVTTSYLHLSMQTRLNHDNQFTIQDFYLK